MQKLLVTSHPLITPYTFMSELADMAIMRGDDTPYARALKPFNASLLRPFSIIYCVTDQARLLYDQIKGSTVPLFLILGRSVYPVTAAYKAFVKDCNVKHIFAQNCCVEEDEYFTPIPLGVENLHYGSHGHGSNSLGILLRAMEELGQAERSDGYFASFSVGTNKIERKECLRFAASTSYTHFGSMAFNTSAIDQQTAFYRKLSSFRFSVCPWGNGIDTHRFWQSLCLGCQPIVRKHAALRSFEDTGAIFIDTWDELTDYSHICALGQDARSRMTPEKVFFDFWRDLIQRKMSELTQGAKPPYK